MTNIPKDLLLRIYDNKDNISSEDYNKRLELLFHYCQENLRTTKVVYKLLSDLNIKIKKKSKVLFLSGSIGYRNVNYTRELLLYGLKKLYNKQIIDYPKVNVLYKDCENLEKYVGKGFTYGGKIDDLEIDRTNIGDRIKSREFDLVIYGRVGNKDLSLHSCNDLPFWKDVEENYNKKQILFVYGGDKCRKKTDHDLLYHSLFGMCAVRELE